MRKIISARIRKFISCSAAASGAAINNNSTPPPDPTGVDLREEYANAFRTESYVEFWARIFSLSNADSNNNSTTAARLPSYRLFAQHLLDPDQPTVTHILASARIQPPFQSILSDYFTQTADASLLCGLLLKDIDRTRAIHLSLKTTTTTTTLLTDFVNPFVSTSSSPTRVRAIQANCLGLLKQLESSRDKARVKLRLVNGLGRGSAVFLVASTASLVVVVAAHVITLLVAMPGLIMASLELVSARGLARKMAQLDAAAKGTYILNRDLDTISQQVARLDDELEHMRAMVKFWIERKYHQEKLQANEEVARQLKKNDCSFSQQLDELEEHLYLCFLTINRARNQVVKEILQPRS